MAGHFSSLDWAVLAAYFAATMGIGLHFRRKSRSIEGFTAAGRALPGWACGLSIFGTYVSSISFLALPGKAYATNWNPFVFSLSLPLATWAAVRFFLPYYRASGDVSAYSHLERRFGPWARIYANLCYLLTQVARVGAVTYLMALPMSVLFGWDIRLIILFTGLCVTVYSFAGGIVAVIWTDVMQSFVLIAGALLCATILLFGMPGGPGQLFAIAEEHHKFSLGSLGPALTEPTFWVVLLYGLAMNLQNFGIDQSYIQRYIASRSDREARKSVWIGGLLYVPVSAVFFFIGTGLFAYYHVHPQDLQEVETVVAARKMRSEGIRPSTADYDEKFKKTRAGLSVKEVGDNVFPHFIGARLPVGVTGLLIAAIFAAAMSTVSTSLNSSATLLMSDYYKRYINKDATEKQAMRVLYGATIIWGALGTGMALLLVRLTESALDAWWTMSGIFGGGMLGLFLLGMISRKARNPAAVTGVLAGLALIGWMTLSSRWTGSLAFLRSPFHAFMIPVFGTLAILLIGLLGSRFGKGAS